jgi:hypothetical protein
MQDIRIDDEGNQRCWNCGGKNFDEKRTFRADYGRVVIYDGKPLLDDSLVITASNALDRVQKRRAALLGLDEPAKIRVETITEDAVDAEIRRLTEELALNGGLTTSPPSP